MEIKGGWKYRFNINDRVQRNGQVGVIIKQVTVVDGVMRDEVDPSNPHYQVQWMGWGGTLTSCEPEHNLEPFNPKPNEK